MTTVNFNYQSKGADASMLIPAAIKNEFEAKYTPIWIKNGETLQMNVVDILVSVTQDGQILEANILASGCENVYVKNPRRLGNSRRI